MLERKGLVVRLVAAVLDTVILVVPAAVLAVALGKLGIVLAGLAYLAYPAVEVLKGQSPGKMILKLRVTARDGSPATQEQLVRRSLIRWGPMMAAGLMTIAGLVVPVLATLGNLAVCGGSIALLVLSWKTMQAENLAFWDVLADTAAVGPVGLTIPGFAPAAQTSRPPVPAAARA